MRKWTISLVNAGRSVRCRIPRYVVRSDTVALVPAHNFDAMRRAGSADPARVRAALASTRDFQGATGSITLDAQRNAVKSAVILEVQSNATRFHETVNPQ